MTEGAQQAALVLGIGGFMGTAAASAARSSGLGVVGVNAAPFDSSGDVRVIDITAPGAVDLLAGLLDDLRPTLVLNCAGLAPRGPAASASDSMYAVNTLGVARLLAAISTAEVAPRVVHLSSAAVYGRDPGSGVAEDSPTDAVGHYARSKLMGDMVCRTFVQSDGVDVVIARPFNVLGPGEPVGSIVSDLATQVLAVPPGATAQASLRETASTRDFLDVRDVADALMVLAEKGTSGEAYNVCSGAATSISGLVSAAASAWDREITLEVAQPGATGTHSIGDPARINALGWSPTRDLRTSLQDISAEFGRS